MARQELDVALVEASTTSSIANGFGGDSVATAIFAAEFFALETGESISDCVRKAVLFYARILI